MEYYIIITFITIILNSDEDITAVQFLAFSLQLAAEVTNQREKCLTGLGLRT